MDVILDVRRRYEVDREAPSDLSNITEQALELLADQLYSTDTHFIMEFIQNAEDNSYPPGVSPTLRMHVKDATMILSCNEKGFTEKNVRAICKIGGSTKKNKPGFIGEKGIGFKSVFKVADVVHVASGPYTFKFDRKRRLGMIAPIWDDSIPATPGWSVFHLNLSSSQGRCETPGTAISKNLNEIKPTLLLFLSTLSSIEVDIKVNDARLPRRVQIKRNNLASDLVQLTRNDNGAIVSKDMYIVIKHVAAASGLRDPKRMDVNETNVVLAFPVDEGRRPQILPQDVHAFLPLRNFGFNFVIHGDFLTPSSRADILHDSPWNLNIRSAIVEAFIEAVQAFQKQPTLRITWIRYLPSGIVDSFFNVLERDIFGRLQAMKVVQDREGILRRPDQVLSIPSHLCYKERPLIPEQYMKYHYLSIDYVASKDGSSLRRLGVRDMTLDDFLIGLSAMHPTSLKALDSEWHENVCCQLSRVPKRSRIWFDDRILSLRILPLDDGSWAQALNASKFVFDSEISGIPGHIDFRRVHQSISESSTLQRYALFRALGVREADPAFIAKTILDFEGHLPPQSHMENALFFFNYRHPQYKLPSPTGRLQLVDEKGNPDTGKNLYLDLPSDNGKLRSALLPPTRFIHSAYMRQFPDRDNNNWLRWLRECLHLNTAPRLVNGKLSLEFREMTQRLSLRDLLDVLKYFWSRWPADAPAPWHEELSHLSVTLDDGSNCTIASMFLKRSALARHSGIAFLPVYDPESKEWNFLGQLGVTIEINAAFFVKLLIRYQSQATDNKNAVMDIYKQLDARFYEDNVQIRNAFNSHPLIFVAPKGTKSFYWIHLSDVYWEGPPSMTSKVALRKIYPNLKGFFQEKLGLSNAPPSIVINDLKCLAKEWLDQTIGDDVHHKAAHMLVDLTKLVEAKKLSDVDVESLIKEHAIFPARSAPTELRLCKLADIYVPDRSGRYAEVFRDKVPMLEFPANDYSLSNISHLLRWAASKGLAQYLESSVDHQMEPRGKQVLEDNLTATYAGRYETIERVVRCSSESSGRQIEVLSKLKEIIICTVDSISLTLTLAGIAPILTHTELTYLTEDESFIAVFISRKIYAKIGTTTRVHIEICKRLSDMFDCDIKNLLLAVTLDRDALDILFQVQGMKDVDVDPAEDDSWMDSSAVRAPPPLVDSSRTDPAPQQSRTRMQSSQDHFSMEELQSETDRIKDSLPDFSASSIHVFKSGHFTSQTLDTLARVISSNNLETMSASTQLSNVEASIGDPPSTAVLHKTIVPTTALDFPSNTSTAPVTTPIRGPEPSSSDGLAYTQINGFLGELYVYELLSTIIGPAFGPENWTSELRRFDPRFNDFKGSSLADFTFEDKEGILTTKLYGEDLDTLKEWEGRYPPTYHIEVKSTSSGSHGPFYLNKRQLDIAVNLTRHGEEKDLRRDVYVIIRVWNIRNPSPDSYAIYVDPIRCILDGGLKIVSEKIELMMGI